MSVNPYEPSRVPDPIQTPVVTLPVMLSYEQTIDDIMAFATDYARRSTVNKVTIGCIGTVAGVAFAVAGLAVDGVTLGDGALGRWISLRLCNRAFGRPQISPQERADTR